MPTVSLQIGSQNYNISCGENEEERLQQIAERFNQRFSQSRKQFASASDQFVLAITALMLEDELNYKEANQNQAPTEAAPVDLPPQPSAEESRADEISLNLAIAEALEPIAHYAEKLADQLEKTIPGRYSEIVGNG